MVPFGGYSMPLTYEGVGQVASHKHVREHAGLFDVGHMVQHMFEGANGARILAAHHSRITLKYCARVILINTISTLVEGGWHLG